MVIKQSTKDQSGRCRLKETIKKGELGRLESYKKCIKEMIKQYKHWVSRHEIPGKDNLIAAHFTAQLWKLWYQQWVKRSSANWSWERKQWNQNE